MEKVFDEENNSEFPAISVRDAAAVGEINAITGHRQELDRHFNLVSICGLALTTGNTWLALGGSLVMHSSSRMIPSPRHANVAQVVAVNNGGRPGAIYELCGFCPLMPGKHALTKEQYCCVGLLLAVGGFHCRACIGNAFVGRRFVSSADAPGR